MGAFEYGSTSLNQTDGTAPTASITYSLSSPYTSGQTIKITATFSEEMRDSPIPKIAITGSGIANVSATNMTKTSSTIYTYDYSVPTGNGTGTISFSVGTDLSGNVVTSSPTSGATFNVDNSDSETDPSDTPLLHRQEIRHITLVIPLEMIPIMEHQREPHTKIWVN